MLLILFSSLLYKIVVEYKIKQYNVKFFNITRTSLLCVSNFTEKAGTKVSIKVVKILEEMFNFYIKRVFIILLKMNIKQVWKYVIRH